MSKSNWAPRWFQLTAVILPSFVAIAAIVTTHLQSQTLLKQTSELKAFEVTFIRKHEAYQELMQAMDQAFYSALLGNKKEALSRMITVRFIYYGIEPLITQSKRQLLRTNLQNYEGYCISLHENAKSGKLHDDKLLGRYSDSHVAYREQVRANLFDALFNDHSTSNRLLHRTR